jgi:hypothetical protein
MFFITFTYIWKIILTIPLTSTVKILEPIVYWKFTESLMFLPLRVTEY